MKASSLPKKKLLTKSWQYRDVYRRGRRLYGRDFGLVYVPGAEGESRLGISIHGVKKAASRNRIKRVIRESFRLHHQELVSVVDVVVTVRPGFALDAPGRFAEAVKALVNDSCPAHATCGIVRRTESPGVAEGKIFPASNGNLAV